MILQALCEYYDRKTSPEESELAPPGFEKKEIPFIIVLDRDGNCVGFEDTREGEGKKRRARQFLVPQSVKRAVNIKANLLWDSPKYVLGASAEPDLERDPKCHEAFKDNVVKLYSAIPNATSVRAVRDFLLRGDYQAIFDNSLWSDCLDIGANLSFRIEGEPHLVCQSDEVRKGMMSLKESDSKGGFCLVKGQTDKIMRLHSAIKGVRGAQSSGANIVSFNLAAFRSFRKEQGGNAPIGEQAAFEYFTALNHLLRKDSRSRIQVGDTTTVFWSERKSELENVFADLFDPPKDNPDSGTKAVSSLLSAPRTGYLPADDEGNRFYVLGLAPNASRLSIRFWNVGSVKGMSETLQQYFHDISIVHGTKQRDNLILWELLSSISPRGEIDALSPILAGSLMQAILSGKPFPLSCLSQALLRARAERDVTYARAAFIKACLNRMCRFNNIGNEKEILMSLDETNNNVAYRLGRLFATLEKLQEEALPGLNSTIRDRYYGAASTTPVTVFARLMRLKNHHLGKLENRGRAVNFERLIGEILIRVDDFPPIMSLEDQGRFAIGYYHQRQAFFTKSE